MQISLFTCFSSASPVHIATRVIFSKVKCDLLKCPLINNLSIQLTIPQTDPSSEITNPNVLYPATSQSFDFHSIITIAIIQLCRHKFFHLVSLLSLSLSLSAPSFFHFLPFQKDFMVHDLNQCLANDLNSLALDLPSHHACTAESQPWFNAHSQAAQHYDRKIT